VAADSRRFSILLCVGVVKVKRTERKERTRWKIQYHMYASLGLTPWTLADIFGAVTAISVKSGSVRIHAFSNG